MWTLEGGIVLPMPFHSLVLASCHIVHLCYGCTIAIDWQLKHGKIWVRCTHALCTSFRNLPKKVALQPYICMGGPTLGLTRGPPCYILMRPGNGISKWSKDMPP